MIFGLEANEPLPEGWIALEAVATVKCLNAEGHTTLLVTSTCAVEPHEQVGMFMAGLDEARANMRAAFEFGSGEPEE